MNSSFQNAIDMKARFVYFHQQESFDDDEMLKILRQYPLHIYFICRAPRVKLDNSKTAITETDISFTFYTEIEGIRKDIPIKTINNADRPIKRIECDYPYNLMKAYSPDGSLRSEIKTNLLMRSLAAQQGSYYDEFNLEVLYIGQAFGKKGERITIDRLKTHEKAQKIYFETQQKFPDYEIWFASFTFIPILITLFHPWSALDPKKMDADIGNQKILEETDIPNNEQITLAEAALIKYFNTYEYNKEYLDFPSVQHKSYETLYHLDFNSAAVELSSESIYSKFFSKSIAPSFFHVQSFFLHDKTERKSMFEWYK